MFFLIFKHYFNLGGCSFLTVFFVGDALASGQIPMIINQPQTLPSTPLEHPAQQTIYVPIPWSYPAQT